MPKQTRRYRQVADIVALCVGGILLIAVATSGVFGYERFAMTLDLAAILALTFVLVRGD